MKKTIFQHVVTLPNLATVAVLLTILYFFLVNSIHLDISSFFVPNRYIGGIFNTNQLSIAHLYLDIFIRHSPFSAWTFSPTPYFFPDALAFFIVAACINNINLAILVINVIWLLLYYHLLVSVGQKVCGKHYKNLFRFSALISLFLACGPLAPQEVFVPLWTSHFGSTILMHLLGVFLVLKLLEQEKWYYYLFLTSIVFFTSLSDPYFFVVFCGSIAGGLLALMHNENIKKSLILRLMGFVMLFGFLGFMANFFDWFHLGIRHFFDVSHKVPVSAHFSWESVIRLREILMLFYQKNPLILLGTLFTLILGIKAFFVNTLPVKSRFMMISIASGIVITVVSSIVMDPDLLNPVFFGLRHFQTALILPTFLGLPIFLAQYETVLPFVDRYYGYFLAVLMACLLLFNPYESIQHMTHIYPPVTQCLDEHAKHGELISNNGVSKYWDARVNTMLSHENVNVVTVSKSLNAYNWISTSYDYVGKTFHFVLIRKNKLPAEQVTAKWGNPNKILDCLQDNHYMIYVYEKGFTL